MNLWPEMWPQLYALPCLLGPLFHSRIGRGADKSVLPPAPVQKQSFSSRKMGMS